MLDIDRVQANVGETVELKEVLLLGGNGDIRVGAPTIDGARVLAEVLEHGRDKKIRVFKYKNKTRYRRRLGHRQDFTRLAIRQILGAGEEPAEAPTEEKPKRTARRRPAAGAEEVATAETLSAKGLGEGAPEVTQVPVRPRRARRPRVEPAGEAVTESPSEAETGREAEAGAKPARRRAAPRRKPRTAEKPAAESGEITEGE